MAEASSASLKGRRISPKGMIDLPFNVRKSLGFVKGQARYLTVSVENGEVRLAPAEKPGPGTVRASPKGLLQLPPEALKLLAGGTKGRYAWSQGRGQTSLRTLGRPASP
jgi:hypothetical protein